MINIDEIIRVLNSWDPIGVTNEGVEDEYNFYAPGIKEKLEKNASYNELKAYLYEITQYIGLCRGPNDREIIKAANDLIKLREEKSSHEIKS